MTIHRSALRTLNSLCSKFVRRRDLPLPTDCHNSGPKRRRKRWLVYSKLVSQFEQERRRLQEGLESAQRTIDQTRTLINEAQAARARAHIRAMLSQMKEHSHKSSKEAA